MPKAAAQPKEGPTPRFNLDPGGKTPQGPNIVINNRVVVLIDGTQVVCGDPCPPIDCCETPAKKKCFGRLFGRR